MCRNIRTLFNFEPPVTDDEIRAASLQFVRKLKQRRVQLKTQRRRPGRGRKIQMMRRACLFAGLQNPFIATRYHSLCAVALPEELEACAWSVEDDVVQGLRHRSLPITGVQFHPESVLTTEGKALLANFLRTGGV